MVAPHAGQGIVDVTSYLESVMSLRSDLKAGALELLVSDEIYATLEVHGLFPLRDSIESFLVGQDRELAGTGADVARLLLEILERCTSIEEYLGAFDLTSSVTNAADVLSPTCSCHPALNDTTKDALDAAVAVCVLEPRLKAEFLASHRIATARYDALNAYRTILSADGRLAVGPATISFSVPLAHTLEGALAVLDAAEMLTCPDDDLEFVELAIRAACLQHSPPIRERQWRLGSQFLSDVVAPPIRSSVTMRRKVLRACCEIIGRTKQEDSHALRTGAGGGNPQVRSGEYRAWRQDVDGEWHIHFWMADDGRIQMASIRGHYYMSIPDPIPWVP